MAGLYVSLPPYLTVGPRLILPLLIAVMVVLLLLTHGAPRVNHAIALTMTAVMTGAMGVSLWLLVAALPAHKESGAELIRSAASLWLTNILVFALWYWRLDAGGPHRRGLRERHTRGAFLFPQMQTAMWSDEDEDRGPFWAPQFIDYLFLAFNTSTAFSPTDTPIMTRWGKILMMVQSLISLTVLALLAARAVNIL